MTRVQQREGMGVSLPLAYRLCMYVSEKMWKLWNDGITTEKDFLCRIDSLSWVDGAVWEANDYGWGIFGLDGEIMVLSRALVWGDEAVPVLRATIRSADMG